ncbi:hypothetical protein E3N88_29501 [Mikania micrantha]|uniref:Uncharacterized protein n=1 Tax=Mikania micrantha TaxID=192012 RepID=A0A5N6MJK6_9ASTR|nr:hypothetical protein E3N88_29501 [Mikania micrantha]
MSTFTRIPILLHADGFTEWKWRFENHAKLSDAKIVRSFSVARAGNTKSTFLSQSSTESASTKSSASLDGNLAASSSSRSENGKALVVQEYGGYNWSDKLKSLSLEEPHALTADIARAATFKVHAFFSKACINKVGLYRVHNSELIEDMQDLKRPGYSLAKNEKLL